jgi:hypothetical protein
VTAELSPEEADDLLARLRRRALFEVRLRLVRGGRVVEGRGRGDEEAIAITVPRALRAGEDAMIFPTPLLAHRIARYVELGPRPPIDLDRAVPLPAAVLEQASGSPPVADLSLPPAAHAAVAAADALNWQLTLTGCVEDAGYEETTHVLDAGEYGIWAVIATEHPDEVLLAPADSTIVWRALSTMLPTPDELADLMDANGV